MESCYMVTFMGIGMSEVKQVLFETKEMAELFSQWLHGQFLVHLSADELIMSYETAKTVFFQEGK